MILNFTYRGLRVRVESYYNYQSGKVYDRGYTLKAYSPNRFWFDTCLIDGDYELPNKVTTTDLLAKVKPQLDALADLMYSSNEIPYLSKLQEITY